jgi:hypothetical protein
MGLTVMLTFMAARVSALDDAEMAKIEALLTAVGQKTDIQFIRNKKAFSAREAEKHLRRKLATVRNKLTSVDEFIDKVASVSSMSGEDYLVKLPDGRIIPARSYFRDLLASISSS